MNLRGGPNQPAMAMNHVDGHGVSATVPLLHFKLEIPLALRQTQLLPTSKSNLHTFSPQLSGRAWNGQRVEFKAAVENADLSTFASGSARRLSGELLRFQAYVQ